MSSIPDRRLDPNQSAESITAQAISDQLSLEEFKLMVGGSTTTFQILVGWFSFFFTFQWVAVAFVLEKVFVEGKASNLVWPLVAASFVFFHANGLFAVQECRRYFQVTLSRIKVVTSSIQDAGLQHQCKLYISCSLVMFLALAVSGLVWIYLLCSTFAQWWISKPVDPSSLT